MSYLRRSSLTFVFVMAFLFGLIAQARPAEEKTIVLVHGAFANSSSWQKVIPPLKAKGYKVIAVENPLTSLADDVKTTKRILANQKPPIILVAHSWGGAVISELGSNPNVAALVYVGAFAPSEGKSVGELLASAKHPAPGLLELVTDSEGFASLTEKGINEYFMQDASAEEKIVGFATQVPLRADAFNTKTSVAAWRSTPSWYLITDNDHMIPPDLQDNMSKAMNAKVRHVNSSHVPMLSQPNAVVDIITEAAEQSGN